MKYRAWRYFFTLGTIGLIIPFHLQAYEMVHDQTLQQQTELIKGLGDLHHPVTTKNPEAQRFFDQGLSLIYAFNHDAAYRSFEQAAQLDPQMAMAYWGMALALGSNINMPISPERELQANQLVQKAVSLSDPITDAERRYIQALVPRYPNNPKIDPEVSAIQYRDAMRKLMQDYPDDLDAAVLFVDGALTVNPWDQWTLDGRPKPGTLEIVETLEAALKKDPSHIGANHYYIHAVEASKHPERAWMSAERLYNRYPASGHLLHMPSHIYILVGNYHQAALANEAAVQADRDYIRQYGIGGLYPVHYMSHNLYFLSRAYSLEGRYTDSKRAADELVSFYAPHFKEMSSLEYYQPTSLLVMIRFHHWREILETPPPPSDMHIATTLWYFAKGMAYAGLGQTQEALEEQKRFEEAREHIPSDALYGYNKAGHILLIAHDVLEAKIAESQNNWTKVIQHLEHAVNAQDTLSYNEPPDWFFPLKESLGAALLKTGQWQKAEQVFRQDLENHPRDGRALFGLLLSLQAQKKTADAYWVQQAYQKAWQYADRPLNLEDLL